MLPFRIPAQVYKLVSLVRFPARPECALSLSVAACLGMPMGLVERGGRGREVTQQ
jgi:hypothetical protein